MAVRQIGRGSVAIPADAVFLEFPRSDAEKSNWPANTKKVVDKDGSVNYMSPQTIDEAPSPIWRRNAGVAVAKALNMDGASEGRTYILKDWPAGYKMFIHLKGAAQKPRTDPYLYGSSHVLKFRSSNEFAPHAIWLFTDETLTHSNCQCKYSTKKSQLSISQSMGLKMRPSDASPSPSSAPRLSQRGRPKREMRARTTTKPYTAVRRAPKPSKRATGPKTAVLSERNNDITDSLMMSEVQPPRLYRPGEVIWCRLKRPIPGPTGNQDNIEFWPGVVDDMDLKITPIPKPDDVSMGDLHLSDANDRQDDGSPGIVTRSRRIHEEAATAEITWEVKQHYVYQVKLLATSHFCHITDTGALPYLAYSLRRELLDQCFIALNDVMNTVDVDEMDTKLNGVHDFDPFYDGPEAEGSDGSQRYRQAAIPYTLAVEVAKNLTGYWTPTDPWEYSFTVPPLPASGSQNAGSLTLQTAIASAMAQNARQTAMSPITGANGKSREELKETATNMLGQNVVDNMPQTTSSTAKTVTQPRYQGLWWGAERIWNDELVRLKLARYQFAPAGAPAVYPPSGMSASTAAAVEQQASVDDVPPEAYGAGGRGMFMKIEGLFVADIPTPDGMVRECRASGMVYELADVDWDPAPEGGGETAVKGKGKERATDAFLLDPDLHALPSASQPGTPVKGVSTAAVPFSEAGGPLATPKGRTSSAQMSPPARSHYDLPPAPTGFKFHPILPPGHEVVLSLSLISGRYYPGILNHPLLHDTVQDVLRTPDKLADANYLWALQGTLAGIYQSMEPQFWKTDRHSMLVDADQDARTVFATQWQEIKARRVGANGHAAAEASGSSHQEAGLAGPAPSPDVQIDDLFGPSPEPSASSAVSVEV